MNPFKSRWPIEDRAEWMGNQQVFDDLESCVDQKVNAFVLGPQGSGKTALLNCFFTFAYRKEMAAKRRILIYSADLSTRADGEDICNYLADQLKHSLRRLLRGNEELEEILEGLKEIESESGETRLQQIIGFLHEEYRYFIVLVMDNFELFTSSASITMEHHEKLRSLIESRMLQCIVATDYDLSKDSLPSDVKGSYLLQKFTHGILVPAFSEKEAVAFVQEKQKKSDLQLPESVIRVLYRLSGGIPWLLEASAECAYDNMQANGGQMNGKETKEAVYRACLPIMMNWCKLFTGQQVQVLKQITAQIREKKELAGYDFAGEPALLGAAASLKARGIVRQVCREDSFGNVIRKADSYVCFNCLLFQRFCKEGMMEKAAQENPLLARELRGGDFLPGGNRGQSGSLSERDKTGMEEDSAQVVNHFHFYEGSKANLPGAQDFSQTIRAEQVQIQQGISPAQILGLLKNPEDIRQLFAGRLSMHLQEESSPGGMHVPLPGEGVGEEESAWQYDLEYDRVGRQIVQDVEVDEEQDLVNVTLEELQTLDARFAEARARCRVEITDEMLETQSERCRFYVKLAVVVEDALQFPGAFSMDDFSPQLVLYGKALEQALRDNLYELFHREPRLSVYSTYSHSENAAASDVFKNKTERETYIGNYAFLIKDQKKYLGELCQRYASDIGSFPAAASWSQWWNQLQLDIHCARRIRNLTDHADETSPDKKNLDHMCALLFGAGDQRGILEKTGIGKKLCVQIFPPALSSDVVEKLVGTFCEMQCTHLKQNGGIRGRTCAGGYPVNISPRKVERYKKTLAGQKFQPVQQVFTVKILEWKIQNGTEFFSAEFADASADRRQE